MSPTKAADPASPAQPADDSPAKKPVTRKRTATRKAASSTNGAATQAGEAPWTTAELRAIRETLEAEIVTYREEIQIAEHEVVDLMRHSGDGAGDDQADAGSKTFEREQEMSLANNSREMLIQARHAIERLENGTYGVCESCGNAIGKLRLEAQPRATLCVTCKSKQERR